VVPFYAFPAEVRRILYTTDAIEALNAKLCSVVWARGRFSTDEAALKLLYLVLSRTAKEWTMPPREWAMAMAQFAVLFGAFHPGHGLNVSFNRPAAHEIPDTPGRWSSRAQRGRGHASTSRPRYYPEPAISRRRGT
jgi:hypothetical protein